MDHEEFEKEMHYVFEGNRLASFGNKWVYSDDQPCNAATLAEAGFVYIGTRNDPDTVKCFFCNKTLDGWDSTDDPWQEHLAHSTTCKWAKAKKGEDLYTLQEFIDILLQYVALLGPRMLEKKKEGLKEVFDRISDKIDDEISKCESN